MLRCDLAKRASNQFLHQLELHTTVDTKCNSLSYRILRKGNRCPNFHGRFAGHFHMATSIWTNKEKEIVGGRRVINASRF